MSDISSLHRVEVDHMISRIEAYNGFPDWGSLVGGMICVINELPSVCRSLVGTETFETLGPC